MKSPEPFRAPMSLRLRLAWTIGTGTLSTLLVATGYLYWGFQHEIRVRDRQVLEDHLQEVAVLLEHRPGDQDALEEEIREKERPAQPPMVLLRVLEGPRLLAQTAGMEKALPMACFQGRARVRREGRRFLLQERALGRRRIQGALDIAEDERLIHLTRQRLLTTLLAGAGLSAALGAWAAHRGLRPLRDIVRSTQGITASSMGARLDPGRVPRELRELVQALNEMLDRLDHAFHRLERFSADLAHEFRTPITVLMGEAEVVLSRERPAEDYRLVLESSLEEFRRLSRLISRMLFLARAEDPRTVLRARDLEAGRLVAEVIAYFEAPAEESGIHLEGQGEGIFRGEADLLRQALANLVSNALEATPAGGRVTLSARVREGAMDLAVRDTGRGIPPREIPRIQERFYRTGEALDRKRPGTGLGLAIVQSIARLHGGEVHIESRVDEGTTVTLRLPLSEI